ncbi:MAG TPA: YgaP-like transmembrane domain [Acidimicrobiales bacterium]|nr:YgaP-like transmembrane domain [Acidimicrobiales bacterium]
MNLTRDLSNTPTLSCAAPLTRSKQRILFLLAGTFTLTGTALAVGVNRWFAVIPAVVGANQLFMSALGWCPMSKLLDRVLVESSS